MLPGDVALLVKTSGASGTADVVGPAGAPEVVGPTPPSWPLATPLEELADSSCLENAVLSPLSSAWRRIQFWAMGNAENYEIISSQNVGPVPTTTDCNFKSNPTSQDVRQDLSKKGTTLGFWTGEKNYIRTIFGKPFRKRRVTAAVQLSQTAAALVSWGLIRRPMSKNRGPRVRHACTRVRWGLSISACSTVRPTA